MFNSQSPQNYSPYDIEKLHPKHVDQAINLVTHSFCDSEPMAQYMKLDYKEFSPFAEFIIEKAAHEEMSVVVLEGDQVIACAIVEDVTKQHPLDFELSPKFKPILAFLEALTKQFFVTKNFGPNLLSHLFITAVEPNYRGLGLSKKANFAGMQLAYDNNFQFMYSELTNYLNEKGTIKYLQHNKLLLGSIAYHKFEYEGKHPFKNLPGIANAYLWELCGDAMLQFEENGEEKKVTLEQL